MDFNHAGPKALRAHACKNKVEALSFDSRTGLRTNKLKALNPGINSLGLEHLGPQSHPQPGPSTLPPNSLPQNSSAWQVVTYCFNGIKMPNPITSVFIRVG